MFVTREFTFDSAHFLTDYYGKCERLHGHTYKLHVTLEGKVQSNGMIIDFVILKRVVKKHVLDHLDHHLLNDIMENPSSERLIVWIWDQLKDLQKLLKDELNDPNLGREIQAMFKIADQKSKLGNLEFDNGLKLSELKLWETPSTWVTYRGD
jgi:6-pyruvoyltetrahydropterin/6-carboxytetrahydropterin synthase